MEALVGNILNRISNLEAKSLPTSSSVSSGSDCKDQCCIPPELSVSSYHFFFQCAITKFYSVIATGC